MSWWTMGKCKACRYFDCGGACECVCHSRFREDESDKLERESVLINGESESMDGLSKLFE